MKRLKGFLIKNYFSLLINSLKFAAVEQGLAGLVTKLEGIVPDISKQYSTFILDSDYLRIKVRNLHAFQISLVNKIIEEFKKAVIVDLGDSAGTHCQYILALHSKNKDIRCLSVNLDDKSIAKIKAKGLEAIKSRVEDLDNYDMHADMLLCFETLEHLMSPCNFLHQLSAKGNAKYLIITVPYLRRSRVGLHHIRQRRMENVFAENTHIFEFSPEDWKLIARHSGWNIIEDKIYLQYPKRSLFRILKLLWRKIDFEGFYGLVLKRDATYSSRYMDW